MEILSFSEALDRAKLGLFNWFLILIAGLTLTNVLYETSGIGFILPLAQCDLNMSTSDKGLLGASGFVGIIISSHLWGFLADTKGRRAVMLPTLLGGFIVTLLSSLANQFWILLLLRFINGLLISASSATVYAYIDEFHVDRTRSRMMVCFYVVYSLGTMSMPMVAWAILRQSWSVPLGFITFKPWRLYLLVGGTSGLLAGLGLLYYPESPKFLLSIGKEKEAIEVIKTVQRWNRANPETVQIDGIMPEKDTEIQETTDTSNGKNLFMTLTRRMWSHTVPLFKKPFRNTSVLICIIQFWIFLIMHGVYVWFPDITDNVVEFKKEHPNNDTYMCKVAEFKESHLDHGEFGTSCDKLNDRSFLYLFAVEVVFCLEFVVIGVIGDRVKKIYILFAALVMFGICGMLVVSVNNLVAALCMFVLLFGCGVAEQVLGGATSELYPTHLRGLALCISMMIGRMGGVVGSYTIGILLENYCELAFYVSGGGLVVCGLLALLIPKQFEAQ